MGGIGLHWTAVDCSVVFTLFSVVHFWDGWADELLSRLATLGIHHLGLERIPLQM